MSKHTPGPWKVSGHYNTGEGHTVTHIHTGAYSIEFAQGVLGRTLPETHANATLIAAAPELLEALVDLVHQHRLALDKIGEPFEWGDLPIETARAAIAKAKA